MARTIVHLSDLHFGRVDPAILPALRRAVAVAAPDLVAVSGDITQRARIAEFKAAAHFLETLPAPLLVVPGNHDLPLYNVLLRWLSPLDRYRRFITSDLAPFYEDAEIAVLGVNTARALTFKDGRINRAPDRGRDEAFRAMREGCHTDRRNAPYVRHTRSGRRGPARPQSGWSRGYGDGRIRAVRTST